MKDKCDVTPLLKKKKRKNSRRKGNKFENDVCKALNARFETTEFCRSPGSGAFATTHKLPEHLKLSGDILTPKHFRFTIECKAGYAKELQVTDFVVDTSWLGNILDKAEDEALRENKDPLVIVKQDRKKPIAVINYSFLQGRTQFLLNYVIITLETRQWIVLPFDKLLEQGNDFFYSF